MGTESLQICVSPSVDMLPFGVTIPVTVPQRLEIPEGLMNYPVFERQILRKMYGYVKEERWGIRTNKEIEEM